MEQGPADGIDSLGFNSHLWSPELNTSNSVRTNITMIFLTPSFQHWMLAACVDQAQNKTIKNDTTKENEGTQNKPRPDPEFALSLHMGTIDRNKLSQTTVCPPSTGNPRSARPGSVQKTRLQAWSVDDVTWHCCCRQCIARNKQIRHCQTHRETLVMMDRDSWRRTFLCVFVLCNFARLCIHWVSGLQIRPFLLSLFYFLIGPPFPHSPFLVSFFNFLIGSPPPPNLYTQTWSLCIVRPSFSHDSPVLISLTCCFFL